MDKWSNVMLKIQRDLTNHSSAALKLTEGTKLNKIDSPQKQTDFDRTTRLFKNDRNYRKLENFSSQKQY